MFENSERLFKAAQKVIPGGVNSPVRAFKSVGGTPIFFKSAKGAYLYDVDGNKYIDYVNSWGPMIMGHAYEPVVNAIREQALLSTSFGAPTELETKMAELIVKMVPNIDQVRMVNSGTEACMTAIRLARGYTGRNKIIKFDGCYHGHADSFLVNGGSGMATLGIQNVPGVTAATAEDTLTATYNNVEEVEELVKKYPGQIAAIIVEPVAGNMGCILPLPGFLEGLRAISDREGIVYIFDEVMTGFRLARGGAQELFGINADLVTFGKIIGGGLPVGALAGKKEIMENLAPVGKVYQAGTLSGNPIAIAAGLILLKELDSNKTVYLDLDNKGKYLARAIKQVSKEKGSEVQVNQVGSMLSIFFSNKSVSDYEDVKNSKIKEYNKIFHTFLNKGIYLPPSPFESWFISLPLELKDLDYTIQNLMNFLFKLA